MPGANLTREEATERTRTVRRVDRYAAELDLGSAPRGGTFRSVTLVRFTRLVPGATTFVDLVATAVHSVESNGRSDLGSACADGRLLLDGITADNELRVVADFAYGDGGGRLQRFDAPDDSEVYLHARSDAAGTREWFCRRSANSPP